MTFTKDQIEQFKDRVKRGLITRDECLAIANGFLDLQESTNAEIFEITGPVDIQAGSLDIRVGKAGFGSVSLDGAVIPRVSRVDFSMNWNGDEYPRVRLTTNPTFEAEPNDTATETQAPPV